METCEVCGRMEGALLRRTYKDIGRTIVICFDCTFQRAKNKAKRNKSLHRPGIRIRNQLIKELGHFCQRCGRQTKIIGHHKMRIMDDGENTKENIELLCSECHDKAHAKGTRW